MKLRIRIPTPEVLVWLAMAFCLAVALTTSFVVLMLDPQRITYDDSNKTFKCPVCSDVRYHLHHGYLSPHAQGY